MTARWEGLSRGRLQTSPHRPTFIEHIEAQGHTVDRSTSEWGGATPGLRASGPPGLRASGPPGLRASGPP
ncbi:MAG: hypothetical protein AAGN82_31475, partial [Myxococcota bacterium]